MLILKHPTAEHDSSSRIVALFGVGTVGSAVARCLASNGWQVTQRIELPWNESDQFPKALEFVYDELTPFDPSEDDHSVSFVWCAGRAGFDVTALDADHEMVTFEQVLRLFEAVHWRRPNSRWHQISSAGGLFEGQRLVDSSSQPDPQRPYGWLKLRQELALRSLPQCAHNIYRLTSVFSPPHRGYRCGLIPTLASNGVLGRVTRISGRSTTLRDFTWADDVAAFIVRELRSSPAQGHNTFLLASGRPASIGEVHRLIEQTLRRHLYVTYGPPQNDCDITFGTNGRLRGFVNNDLRSCIRRVCQDFLADPAQRT